MPLPLPVVEAVVSPPDQQPSKQYRLDGLHVSGRRQQVRGEVVLQMALDCDIVLEGTDDDDCKGKEGPLVRLDDGRTATGGATGGKSWGWS